MGVGVGVGVGVEVIMKKLRHRYPACKCAFSVLITNCKHISGWSIDHSAAVLSFVYPSKEAELICERSRNLNSAR